VIESIKCESYLKERKKKKIEKGGDDEWKKGREDSYCKSKKNRVDGITWNDGEKERKKRKEK
jgi:hypothetical protein